MAERVILASIEKFDDWDTGSKLALMLGSDYKEQINLSQLVAIAKDFALFDRWFSLAADTKVLKFATRESAEMATGAIGTFHFVELGLYVSAREDNRQACMDSLADLLSTGRVVYSDVPPPAPPITEEEKEEKPSEAESTQTVPTSQTCNLAHSLSASMSCPCMAQCASAGLSASISEFEFIPRINEACEQIPTMLADIKKIAQTCDAIITRMVSAGDADQVAQPTQTVEQPTEQSAAQHVEQLVESTPEQPAEQSVDQSATQSAAQSETQQVETEQPADQPAAQPADIVLPEYASTGMALAAHCIKMNEDMPPEQEEAFKERLDTYMAALEQGYADGLQSQVVNASFAPDNIGIADSNDAIVPVDEPQMVPQRSYSDTTLATPSCDIGNHHDKVRALSWTRLNPPFEGEHVQGYHERYVSANRPSLPLVTFGKYVRISGFTDRKTPEGKRWFRQ
jgi:hypothetical protein